MLCHVDGAAGLSGDMALGALVDLGVSVEDLRAGLASLDVPGWTLTAERTDEQGLVATRVVVDVPDEHHPHRGLSDIRRIVTASALPAPVKESSIAVFRRLCEAEAEVHGCAVDEVHLHEVGAVDAIVDVCGTVLGLHLLSVTSLSCSPPDVGGGTVTCRHGVLPVPAPATVKLLAGRPIRTSGVEAELLTPTGAALLSTLSARWGTLPPMIVERVGLGAGTRQLPDRANVVRFVLGRPVDSAAAGRGEVLVLEADLDDAEPQALAAFCDRARELGALDAVQAPVVMKKGRSGVRLTLLCTEATRGALVDALLSETPTIGCRWHRVERAECEREIVETETPYGPVRVKVSRWRGRIVNEKPEHDDCASAARRHGVPLSRVVTAALGSLAARGDGPAGAPKDDGRRQQ